MGRTIQTTILVALAYAVAGCATISPGEGAYLALHAVDVAQTLQIAKEPDRYREVQIDAIIGVHPSQARVLEWGAASAIGSYALDRWLYESNHPVLATFFESVQLMIVVPTVKRNFQVGLHGKF